VPAARQPAHHHDPAGRVRAEQLGAEPVVGTAVDLTDAGALVVQTGAGARVPVPAADLQHLGPLEQPGVEGSRRRGCRRQQPKLMRLPRREPRSR
jgi:Biotin protein ligase C terminal domain